MVGGSCQSIWMVWRIIQIHFPSYSVVIVIYRQYYETSNLRESFSSRAGLDPSKTEKKPHPNR